MIAPKPLTCKGKAAGYVAPEHRHLFSGDLTPARIVSHQSDHWGLRRDGKAVVRGKREATARVFLKEVVLIVVSLQRRSIGKVCSFASLSLH